MGLHRCHAVGMDKPPSKPARIPAPAKENSISLTFIHQCASICFRFPGEGRDLHLRFLLRDRCVDLINLLVENTRIENWIVRLDAWTFAGEER